jgi:hypothetical protein
MPDAAMLGVWVVEYLDDVWADEVHDIPFGLITEV